MTDLFQTANDFSANLFVDLSAGNANLILSPFSILSTLYLLLWGSGGTTKSAIANTLKINTDRADASTEAFNIYKKSLKEQERSFLFNDYILLKQTEDIKQLNAFKGKSDIQKIDFTKGVEAARTINGLVQTSTGGLIKNIVDANSISPDTIMQILNTVYFKGAWEREFADQQINEAEFKNFDGQTVKVDMLTSKNNKLYASYDKKGIKAQIVELPYRDSNLTMLVVLPDKNVAIDTFISQLPTFQGPLLKTETYDTKVDFTMPKFKFDNQLKLNDVLARMGLSELFSYADLSKMIATKQPIQISDITHAAVIEVDEKGTKAAAATKISVVSYSFIHTSNFVCDRPFMFYIIDRETRIPLFTGVVKNLPDKFGSAPVPRAKNNQQKVKRQG